MQHFLEKVLKKLKKLNSSFFLIFLGLLIFFFGAFNYYRIRVLSFSGPPPKITSQIVGERATKIIIPSIGIDLPIDEGEIKNGVWQISYKNATHLISSSNPDSSGNIVIYGHNKRAIFGNLPYLSIGQEIILKTESGELHKYEVYRKDFINPDRIDLVSPTDFEELTVFTCWGLFDSQRVVIKAKPND